VFEYAKTVDDRLSFMVGKMDIDTVSKFVKFTESKKGAIEAVKIFEWLLVTRFEMYQIQLYSLLSKKGNTSFRQV